VFERFTPEARSVVVQAQLEARSLAHDHVGTEHLLLGLLAEGHGIGAWVLSDLGFDGDELRRAVAEVARFDHPVQPDPAALETIGIDLDEVRRSVERTFGPGALERTRAARHRARRGRRQRSHVPFTPRAKKVLELSLRVALNMRHRDIRSEHLLLGMIMETHSTGARLLERAGVDLGVARRRVIEEITRRAGG
jgi:ATP-dependent Clp protease ATP-binding subunit ClpA